jgi:anaerobic magnesium-protoporphyrin IX monomethyl ester cyclase
MKVLLIKPYNKSDHIQPSLGLGYLAQAIRDKHEVEILDCIKENVGAGRLTDRIKKYDPDVIGLQCYTFDLGFIDAAIKSAKHISPRIVTVAGGPHPSAAPGEMMEIFKDRLDFCFRGEAETGFPKLLEALKNRSAGLDSVPGLVWRTRGEVIFNSKTVIDNLDSIPMPAWDLIRPETYPESQHGAFFKQFPIAPIMVTRGCPFPCTFCAGSVVSGKKIRRRSIENVLNELVYLNKERGIREFHIIDDNFTMDASYAKELLRRLKKLKLGMTWAVPNGVRMDTLDEELLSLMKETGLYIISLGIESGSDRVLGDMKKQLTTFRARECVRMINRSGIDVAGFFIMGFPGETVDTIKETIRFARELELVRANFFTYLPFPGSESYENLRVKNELHGIDWNSFYFTNASYVPVGLTRRKLKNLQRLAFASFYLRPRVIYYNIRSIKSFRHLLFLIRRFFNWIVLG